MARWLARLMDAQDGWVQPLGTWAHGLLHRFFHWVPGLRDLLNGRWLGHPVHALLTDAPIGMLFLTIVLDVVGQPVAAEIALGLGVLGMVAAAAAGLADYSDTDGRARDRATLHASVMLVALVIYLASLVLRLTGDPSGAGVIWLSILAFLVLAAGAFVGGDVVYVNGNMVDRHAFRGTGTKWISLEPSETNADGSIPEGKLVRARLGVNTLVLVRDGDRILALHDTCAHAGGPLSGATYADGIVECPWHGSRYRMSNGHVIQGPSVYDQPAYEVRARDGGGWEARRQA
ncbi:MAG TPA: Rieske (2Fe-2S) protein [Candidatus Limnocylindrales bacterium]|nr:Rieske (2Fe-2S) protein [Candidatus Limnocylindrales bacterium]